MKWRFYLIFISVLESRSHCGITLLAVFFYFNSPMLLLWIDFYCSINVTVSQISHSICLMWFCSVNTWNTPTIFDLKEGSVTLIVQAEKYALLLQRNHYIIAYMAPFQLEMYFLNIGNKVIQYILCRLFSILCLYISIMRYPSSTWCIMPP